MDREAKLNEMRVALTKKMEEFMEDSDEIRGEIGCWAGDGTARYMAEAALAVLAATFDVNDYLEREGHLTVA